MVSVLSHLSYHSLQGEPTLNNENTQVPNSMLWDLIKLSDLGVSLYETAEGVLQILNGNKQVLATVVLTGGWLSRLEDELEALSAQARVPKI